MEGALDADCVLTCNRHNWKFDLKTGATLYGGDNLRICRVKVEHGALWLDVRDPPGAERIERALQHLEHAIAEFDTARIARELARLNKADAKQELALVRVIQNTHARLRDGMTHAYAAADAWLSLRDTLHCRVRSVGCRGLCRIGRVTGRGRRGRVAQRGVRAGTAFADLESTLAVAALAHYNDFGHSLTYLAHVRRLIERLGTEVETPLLLAWLRSLILATREDLLPEFRHHADALGMTHQRAASRAPRRSKGNQCAGCWMR